VGPCDFCGGVRGVKLCTTSVKSSVMYFFGGRIVLRKGPGIEERVEGIIERGIVPARDVESVWKCAALFVFGEPCFF